MDANGLQEARDRLINIDERMRDLFVERMEVVRDIAEYKRQRGLPIEHKDIEARMIEKHGSAIEDEGIRACYARFLQATIDASKHWQHRLMEGISVAYSGVEGAFAHVAALRIFPDGVMHSYPSFEETYEAVESGACDVAILPIENSYSGEVGHVLDLMFSGPLHVNGVFDLPIVQNLLGVPGARLSDVETVVSHPQALSQCRTYLQEHNMDMRTAPNTAIAAQDVAQRGDKSVAAIASEETAALYGLETLDHDINESRLNTTRFAVFSRTENQSVGDRDANAFLLLFTVKDEAGGLAKAINIISAYDFNMRVLRSRPMKDLPWHYYFYVEAEGDDNSENGQRMIAALKGTCPSVKVVGRYATTDSALNSPAGAASTAPASAMDNTAAGDAR